MKSSKAILSVIVATILTGSAIFSIASGKTLKPLTKVDSLKWMAGNWTTPMWGGTFEESWLAPVGGTMQGTGRLVAQGKVQFMEFMSIETAANGDITMYMLLDAPSKGAKKPTPFRLTAVKGDSYTFENSKNDFPSKMVYSMKKDSTGEMMHVLLTGKQGGKNTTEEFKFRKK